MKTDNLGVVIPAYNTGSTIESVIVGVLKYFKLDNVVVVNDGSTDDTVNILNKLGVHIIDHGKNLGKGAALRSGFNWAINKSFDGIITLDGDGQHDFDDLPQFIEAFESKSEDIIIGSRMSNTQGMPWQRIITNTLSAKILSLLTHQPIEDAQSGYRLIKLPVIKRLKLTSSSYDFELELLIKAVHNSFKIGFVPIKTIYGNEQSYFNPWIDTYRVCRAFLKGLFFKSIFMPVS